MCPCRRLDTESARQLELPSRASIVEHQVGRSRPAGAEHQADRAAERHRLRPLIAGADLQNQWMLAGDLRGVYGRYPPAALAIIRS